MTQIEIWDIEAAPETKSALPPIGKTRVQVATAEISKVSENLTTVLASFQKVLDAQPKADNGYYVSEIELSLGISGSGSIALLSKLEAGVKASIKVKLKRDSK